MASSYIPSFPSNPKLDFHLLRLTEADATYFALGPSFIEDMRSPSLFLIEGIPLTVDVIYLGIWSSTKVTGRSLRTWLTVSKAYINGSIKSRMLIAPCGRR